MENLPLEMMQLGLHYRFHLWMPETQVTSCRYWSAQGIAPLFMLMDTHAVLPGDLLFPACFNRL